MIRRVAFVLLLVVAAGCAAASAASAPKAASPSPFANSVSSPVASARGWLAYQSVSPRGDDGVFLVRTDGSGDHEILTDLPGRHAHPDFSRDGKYLAIDQLVSEDQVYVADADGSGARLLAPCRPPKCVSHWEPAWSPDGSRLAVSTAGGAGDPPARFGIAIIEVAKETVRPVLDHASRAGQDHFARWSPDGRRLVFWRARYGSGGSVTTAVFVVNVNGTGLRRLTPWRMLAGDPDWSPDGSRIVFNTRPLVDFSDAGQSELYTIRPMRAQPGVDPRHVLVSGVSRGGEAALLLGAYFPQLVNGVIAGVPSSVVNPAERPDSGKPAWTLRGRPLPAVSPSEFGQPNPPGKPQAVIPVERIRGPILLTCGELDVVWPSCRYSDAITARLRAHRFAHPVTGLRYRDAGHLIGGLTAYFASLTDDFLTSSGGTVAATQAAQADAHAKLLALLASQ